MTTILEINDIQSKEELLKAIGQKLQMAREAKKLELDEVGKQLFMSKDRLSSIENGTSRADIYLRGHLIAYAKLLEIPIAEIENQLTYQHFIKNNVEPLPQPSKPIVIQKTTKWKEWINVLVITILLCIIILWLQEKKNYVQQQNAHTTTNNLKAINNDNI